MEHHLGSGYARAWAQQQVIADLSQRTVQEAIDEGVEAKEVWRAVHRYLELPAGDRLPLLAIETLFEKFRRVAFLRTSVRRSV